jgi:hypothetical protein
MTGKMPVATKSSSFSRLLLRIPIEALCLHIEGMIEDGEPIPAPSPIERIRSDPGNRDAVDILVVHVPDELINIRGDRQTADVSQTEGCDLSWKGLDT